MFHERRGGRCPSRCGLEACLPQAVGEDGARDHDGEMHGGGGGMGRESVEDDGNKSGFSDVAVAGVGVGCETNVGVADESVGGSAAKDIARFRPIETEFLLQYKVLLPNSDLDKDAR